MTARVRLDLYVHPASSVERLAWDDWRKRWNVWCRAPPIGGEANARVLDLIARWVGVAPGAVRYTIAGTGRRKQVEVEGLELEEAMARLDRASRSPD